MIFPQNATARLGDVMELSRGVLELSAILQIARQVVHRPDGVGVILRKHPQSALQSLPIETAGLFRPIEALVGNAQTIDRLESVGMILPQHATLCLEQWQEKFSGLLIATLSLVVPEKPAAGAQGIRMLRAEQPDTNIRRPRQERCGGFRQPQVSVH